MKRIVLIFLILGIPLAAMQDPDPQSAQHQSDWKFIVRIVNALSLLFPYKNMQPFIINEIKDDRIPHQTSRVFHAHANQHKE